MPTYEYKCLSCGLRFDVVQSMLDDPLTACKECGGKVKRLIGTGAGVIFKGNGFYATDYRSSSYKTAAKADSAAGSSTPSTDAKPAAAKADSTAGGAAAKESTSP